MKLTAEEIKIRSAYAYIMRAHGALWEEVKTVLKYPSNEAARVAGSRFGRTLTKHQAMEVARSAARANGHAPSLPYSGGWTLAIQETKKPKWVTACIEGARKIEKALAL